MRNKTRLSYYGLKHRKYLHRLICSRSNSTFYEQSFVNTSKPTLLRAVYSTHRHNLLFPFDENYPIRRAGRLHAPIFPVLTRSSEVSSPPSGNFYRHLIDLRSKLVRKPRVWGLLQCVTRRCLAAVTSQMLPLPANSTLLIYRLPRPYHYETPLRQLRLPKWKYWHKKLFLYRKRGAILF